MSKDQLSDEEIKRISDAILAGTKIEAIKRYREATGEGLKEAKMVIDDIENSLAKEHPDLSQAKGSGCAAMVFLGAITGLVIYYTVLKKY